MDSTTSDQLAVYKYLVEALNQTSNGRSNGEISIDENLDETRTSIINSVAFKVVSIGETSIILAIYTFTMCWVLYHVGWSLEKSAYITMLVFFVSELCSLLLFSISAAMS